MQIYVIEMLQIQHHAYWTLEKQLTIRETKTLNKSGLGIWLFDDILLNQ